MFIFLGTRIGWKLPIATYFNIAGQTDLVMKKMGCMMSILLDVTGLDVIFENFKIQVVAHCGF